MGSWRPNGASSIYLRETIDLDIYNTLKKSGKAMSFNSYFAEALGKALSENPRLNSVIRFNRIYRREEVEMFFHVYDNSRFDDLSGVKIKYQDEDTVESLHKQFKNKVTECFNGDPEFRLVKKIFKYAPSFFSRAILDITAFLSYTLNLDLTRLGIPKDSFGSIMVTNVSSFDMGLTFTPIAPYTRIPIVICISRVEKRPVVRDDKLTIAEQLDLGIHFDHRLIDGAQISLFLKSLRHHLYSHQVLLKRDNNEVTN